MDGDVSSFRGDKPDSSCEEEYGPKSTSSYHHRTRAPIASREVEILNPNAERSPNQDAANIDFPKHAMAVKAPPAKSLRKLQRPENQGKSRREGVREQPPFESAIVHPDGVSRIEHAQFHLEHDEHHHANQGKKEMFRKTHVRIGRSGEVDIHRFAM
jgi:hypothetical protein